MQLISEVFPNYNPLPNLVKKLKLASEVDGLDDLNGFISEAITDCFAEAGVLVECVEDFETLVMLLVDSKILGLEDNRFQLHKDLNNG